MKERIIIALGVLIMLTGQALAVGLAADPTRLGVGARPLGMGKAFIGLADDTAAIFLNPAGLGKLRELSATTMTGKFINEVDYISIGFVYPLEKGTIGGGFVNSGISAVLRAGTIEVVGDQFFLIPSTGEASGYSFTDRVFLLSFGVPVPELYRHDWTRDLYLGGNLKFFLVDLTGPGVSGGDARGNELDLALLYAPEERYYSFGLNLQNILPFDFGGKLSYSSGNQESYPAVIKLGSRWHILGQRYALQRHEHELDLLLDYDLSLQSVPGLLHIGAEWKPNPLLALRLGVDQEMVGTAAGGLASSDNLTMGVGMRYLDFRFDYAYHQYQVFRENDTHYFSLSYLPSPRIKEQIKLHSPQDKSIVYEEKMKLTGDVLGPAITALLVSDVPTGFEQDGSFSREIFPRTGKNKVLVVGRDGAGAELARERVRLLRLKPFADVPAGYRAKLPIEFLAFLGVVSGYPDGSFKPDGEITRAEFTKLLLSIRGTEGFQPLGKPFQDIRADHWAAGHIGYGARNGYVKGYPDNTFRPNAPVTRAEGVAMIVRYAALARESAASEPYGDVPGRYWAAGEIAAAKAAGVLEYLPGPLFEPKKALTRGEVAEMLARIDPVRERIADLLDWESY